LRNIARALVAIVGQIGLLAAASATAAPPPDQPPLPGATRILALSPDNSTGKPGMVGSVQQPWLSDHEVLHFRSGSLYRYDALAKTDTLLPRLTHQVKSSQCYLYFLTVSPNGQQVLWGISANNPLFVATVDGARREQWEGSGGMTSGHWCSDGTHWLQFYFGGATTSIDWTKIEQHSLDASSSSETFSPPHALNGLDVLATPSADMIIARTPDPVKFQKPSASIKQADGSMAFTVASMPTLRSVQTISVWSLRQAEPLHQWELTLPGKVQEVAVSPDGQRAAWLLLGDGGKKFRTSLWVSKTDGSGLHKIGSFAAGSASAQKLGNAFPFSLVWVPGDTRVSFQYGNTLWTVRAN